MCDLDYTDGASTVLQYSTPMARKPHKCCECYRFIDEGEKYYRTVAAFDGSVRTYKTCAHCQIPILWLTVQCGWYSFGYVQEDITEHAYYESYAVKRVAVSMRRKWRRRNGTMMPIPAHLENQ